MIDLRSFMKGLKISWLERLYWANVDSPWAHLAKQNFPPVEEMVAFGSIKLKNIKSNVQNVFWQDVISSWADFCTIYKPDNFELLTDKLWYSDNTKFKEGIVREWNNKGLRFVADLFCKHTGPLLSRNSLNEIFNFKMTFLCYSSLIRSIPPRVCNSSPKYIAYPVLPYKIALLGSKRDIAQIAYKHFILDIKTKHVNELGLLTRKWNRDTGIMQEGTLVDVRKSTKSTYLQSFHFRIIARIISTNTFLFRIGRSESHLCTFCNLYSETLKHILWDCHHVKGFIQEIKLHLFDRYNFTLDIDLSVWFFPTLGKKQLHYTVNNNYNKTFQILRKKT